MINILRNDTQRKNLLKNLTIIVDTREQKNQHIIDYFEKNRISYTTRKLDVGDYSVQLLDDITTGYTYDFSKEFAIERKNSLEELSGNLTQDRTRFEQELMEAKARGTQLSLVVEDSNINNIYTGNYNTKYQKSSFIASLITFKYRYGIDINFVNKENMGRFIYHSAYYFLYNQIN